MGIAGNIDLDCIVSARATGDILNKRANRNINRVSTRKDKLDVGAGLRYSSRKRASFKLNNRATYNNKVFGDINCRTDLSSILLERIRSNRAFRSRAKFFNSIFGMDNLWNFNTEAFIWDDGKCITLSIINIYIENLALLSTSIWRNSNTTIARGN